MYTYIVSGTVPSQAHPPIQEAKTRGICSTLRQSFLLSRRVGNFFTATQSLERFSASRSFSSLGPLQTRSEASPITTSDASRQDRIPSSGNGRDSSDPISYVGRHKKVIIPYEYDFDYFRLTHLSSFLPGLPTYPTPLDSNYRSLVSHDTESPYYAFHGEFVEEDAYVDLNIIHRTGTLESQHGMVRAGPRRRIYFDPREVKAAIVSCGGLCPGMNVVIRELVMTLTQNYCVDNILGIQAGYRGFYNPETPPIPLNPEVVQLIHLKGGTMLRSSRGGFDRKRIVDMLETNGINQLYVIGGDGTHKGSNEIAEECASRKLKVSVVGIPKTIDNDIPYIDKSFGFDTSVEQSCKAIDSAYVESSCFPDGIGIVNLMGRHSGFIAMHASLASRLVDVCLIPEIPFQLYGEHGLFEHLHKRLMERGHAVVVLAEGAGQDLLPETGEYDASGNKKLAPIGRYLYEETRRYFQGIGVDAAVKYIDPTYMIRSVPANSTDALYCSFLAQNAVHGAFAGYTAFTTGRVNDMHVYLPMKAITGKPRKVDPTGRFWYGLMISTMQPDFYTVNKENTINDNGEAVL
mmetsp:Transcript_40370/g.65400  ORF Transcript_40370/g.65400 Transcript_40370/m.65400 type:complete len:575 (-) Transcript_40370:521-2245(-)